MTHTSCNRLKQHFAASDARRRREPDLAPVWTPVISPRRRAAAFRLVCRWTATAAEYALAVVLGLTLYGMIVTEAIIEWAEETT